MFGFLIWSFSTSLNCLFLGGRQNRDDHGANISPPAADAPLDSGLDHAGVGGKDPLNTGPEVVTEEDVRRAAADAQAATSNSRSYNLEAKILKAEFGGLGSRAAAGPA